jgi:hypothetical protein
MSAAFWRTVMWLFLMHVTLLHGSLSETCWEAWSYHYTPQRRWAVQLPAVDWAKSCCQASVG